MAKLGKREIIVHSDVDYTQKIRFEVELNVSKDGHFYFTLDEEQKKTLTDLGVDLRKYMNLKTKKSGTFYNTKLESLISDFENLLKEAISGEILVNKYVILYEIRTDCTYCTAHGIPVPNGYYVPKEELKDGQYANWVEGIGKGENGFGFRVYARVFNKQVIRFRSGVEKTFFYVIRYDKINELGEFAKKLNSFILPAFDIKPTGDAPIGWSMGNKKEIAYTEDNAKFFCDLMIAVCKLNEQIKGFVKEPELLQQIIDSQMKFLQ